MAQPSAHRIQAKPANSHRRMFFVWMSGIILIVVLFAMPSVLLIAIGMLPAVAAFIIDRTRQRCLTLSISGLNFCGVFPYLLSLWSGDNSIGTAVDLATDVFALLVMYSAAAFGWLLFMAVPPVVIAVLTVMTERRLVQLRAMQKSVIEEWGEDVAQAVVPSDLLVDDVGGPTAKS